MIYVRLSMALLAGLLTCTAAFASSNPDPERVAAALDALRTSINAHDFSILEPQLDDSFSYQGRDPDFSRMIMRQVVQGYPHEVTAISVLNTTPDGGDWSISVIFEGPGGNEQRQVRLGADYRIRQADIADIELAGHDSRRAGSMPDAAADRFPDTLVYPFSIQDGQIVVQAAINGVDGNFLVDTGAQVTTVNTAHFADGELQTVAFDHGGPSGVGGALTNARAARGLRLTWGDASFGDLRGIALDLSHLEASIGIQVVGLIGYDVLQRFEILFDYEAGLLTLYRLDRNNRPVNAESRGTPRARIPFEMLGHLPVLPVRVNGQDMRLGVDSGAAEAMLAESWEDPMAGQFEFVRFTDIRGADKAVRPSKEVRFDSMTVSDVEYGDVIFRFGDIRLTGGATLSVDGINFRAKELSIW